MHVVSEGLAPTVIGTEHFTLRLRLNESPV